jgi:hypothetical protein
MRGFFVLDIRQLNGDAFFGVNRVTDLKVAGINITIKEGLRCCFCSDADLLLQLLRFSS